MNRSPASSSAAKFASDSIPASATTVTSEIWCAAANAWITGRIVLGLGPVALERVQRQQESRASVNNPAAICGASRRSLEKSGSRNPPHWSVSKYKVVTS